jgi:hypothetical protein
VPAILSLTPQLFQNDGFSTLSTIGETGKNCVGGEQQLCFLVKNSLVKKELRNGGL